MKTVSEQSRERAIPSEEEIERALRRSWFPVARSIELEDPLGVELLGEHLAVFRTAGGRACVINDRCPHRGASLSQGEVRGEALMCAYHGWRWSPEGRCVHIPSLGSGGGIPAKAVIQTYPAIERWGLVWTALEEPLFEPPNPPEMRRNEWTLDSFSYPIEAGIRMATENFRDVAHLPFVHRRTMGEVREEVPLLSVEREGVEVSMDFKFRSQAGTAEDQAYDAGSGILYNFHTIAPAYVFVVLNYEDGTKRLITAFPSPVTLERTNYFSVHGWSPDFDGRGQTLGEGTAFEREVVAEDAAVLKHARPAEAPLDPATEVHSPADRYPLAYRQAFIEFVHRVNEQLPP